MYPVSYTHLDVYKRQVKAPSNLIELAYHDNLEDAMWIINNINVIARTLVLSLTEYFGIPFVDPY